MVFVGTALPRCHLRVVPQPWCGSVTPQLLGSTALPCIKLNIGGVQKGKEKTGQRKKDKDRKSISSLPQSSSPRLTFYIPSGSPLVFRVVCLGKSSGLLLIGRAQEKQ